jgi:hypothetical protein
MAGQEFAVIQVDPEAALAAAGSPAAALAAAAGSPAAGSSAAAAGGGGGGAAAAAQPAPDAEQRPRLSSTSAYHGPVKDAGFVVARDLMSMASRLAAEGGGQQGGRWVGRHRRAGCGRGSGRGLRVC